MPNQALMMLDALSNLYPINQSHREFMERIIKCAYQEGQLAEMQRRNNQKNDKKDE